MSTIVQTQPTIYFIGDAILDNYYNLSNKEQDLKKELSDRGFVVHNYAADHIKVSDIHNGIIVNDIQVKSRSYPYPVHSNGKMYPLKSVAALTGVNKAFSPIYESIGVQSIGATEQCDNMIVISMGGNDMYANVKNIILGPEYFVNTILTPEFITNYKKVIETAKNMCDRIVLISMYLPYLGVGSSYGLYFPITKPVMEKWNKFVHDIGREYNIPILDLMRTLDIGDRTHYGTDEARLSNLSNKCLAECLVYIYSHYHGHHTYFAPKLDYTNIVTE